MREKKREKIEEREELMQRIEKLSEKEEEETTEEEAKNGIKRNKVWPMCNGKNRDFKWGRLRDYQKSRESQQWKRK